MKRSYLSFIMVAVIGLLILGCSSPAEKAQKLFSEGQYQQLIDQFSNDPAMSDLVMQSKEKLAEALLEEGKFETVIEMYPDCKAAEKAKNMLADKMLEEGKLEELIALYPDSPAAMKAKLMMAEARGDSLSQVAGSQGQKIKEQKDTIEKAAERELDRIKKIKNPRLRSKAIDEFVNNDKYKGTKAAREAASMK